MTALSPEPGRIALVRQRRYLVENVTPPPSRDEARLVDLSCLDDDAQGEPLSVLWEHEIDAHILEDAHQGTSLNYWNNLDRRFLNSCYSTTSLARIACKSYSSNSTTSPLAFPITS